MDGEQLIDRSNWFFSHPKVSQLRKEGITDKQYIYHVLTVYFFLIEVQHWFEVELNPCCHLNIVLISGYKDKEKQNFGIFLPVSAGVMLPSSRIDEVMRGRVFQSLTAKKCLNVAIVEADSKIVFYRIGDGLIPPSS